MLHGQIVIAATARKCCVSNSCIRTGPVLSGTAGVGALRSECQFFGLCVGRAVEYLVTLQAQRRLSRPHNQLSTKNLKNAKGPRLCVGLLVF
jgi:hypothetical protein